MKLVSSFWKRNKFSLFLLLIFTLITTATNLSFPYILKNIVDGIQKRLEAKTVLFYVGLLLMLGTLRSFLATLLPFLRGRTNERFAWLCRSQVFSKILEKGYKFSNTFPGGDVIERLDHDLSDLSWFACSGIFRPIEGGLTLLLGLLILISINPLLTLIAIAPLSLAGIFWSKIGSLVYSTYNKWREKISLVCNYIESSMSGIKLLKSFAKEEIQEERFSSLLKDRIDWAIRYVRSEAKVGIVFQGVAEFSILVILILGGILVIKKGLTIGEFVAFMAYIGLLVAPVWDLGNFFVARKRGLAAERRIRELAEFPPAIERKGGVPCPKSLSAIKFNSVSFAYEEARPVLKNINLLIKEGMKIGIAGTVGSGKTTIVKLLLRLLEPISGEIIIDKTPLKEIDLKELRALFGYCPQEPTLFSDTIYNNILFGREGFQDRVSEAVKISGLAEEIKEMPEGIDSLIGERGIKLSGGQKERVAIARGILTSPKILLLDDATASLDAEIEKRVVANLLKEKKTAIIISHRLSLLSLCDIVYVLERGEIVEEGTPFELLAKRGLYWKLYERQLIREELEKE